MHWALELGRFEVMEENSSLGEAFYIYTNINQMLLKVSKITTHIIYRMRERSDYISVRSGASASSVEHDSGLSLQA